MSFYYFYIYIHLILISCTILLRVTNEYKIPRVIDCFTDTFQGELSSLTGSEGRSLSADVGAWNPFEDVQPFNQLTEDHIFGAEFDKIRRGSNTSISGVKSRESLVMACTELPEDPFESAPFSLPSECFFFFKFTIHV